MTTLAEIIKLATWAVERTRKIIPYSSNLAGEELTSHKKIHMRLTRRRATTPKQKQLIQEIFDWNLDLSSAEERYPLFVSELEIKSLNNKRIKFMHLADILSTELRDLKSKPRSDLRLVETLAVKALKFGIGNCREVSAYAMMLLLEYPERGIEGLPKINTKIPIERIALQNKEHAIIILNRNPETILSDITTWNDDTVICDPHLKTVYTKKQLFENKTEEEKNKILKDFEVIIKTELSREREYFIGENYNEQIHSDDWVKKHTGQKYWRPEKLIDVCERPEKVEKLPKLYSPFFEEATTSKEVEKILNKFGGIEKMNSFSGIYTKQEIHQQFEGLNDVLKSPRPYQLPFSIHIENPKHNVDIVYHNDSWIVIHKVKRNEILYRLNNVNEIADKIFELFTDGKTTADNFVAYSADVFKTKVDAKQLNERLNRWTMLKTWEEDLHDQTKVKRIDVNGFSWLHVAAQKNDLKTVNTLLENGIDVTKISKDYKTALDVAMEESNTQIVDRLFKH